MAAMPQEAIQQGSTQPETTKPDKYSISTSEALREGYSVPEPVPLLAATRLEDSFSVRTVPPKMEAVSFLEKRPSRT